jgi:hypothetical protein
MRWLGMSMKPPVPGVEAFRKLSGDHHKASPLARITSATLVLFFSMRAGSTWTCSCRSRWPQIATLPTPGTLRIRGLIFQRARTERSMSDSVVDDSPTLSTRFVVDTGCSMAGRFDTFGRATVCSNRSCTICRASMMSVPGSNVIRMDDSPVIVFECTLSSQGSPLNISSSGTVIRASTSAAARPRASVCTSTSGRENSGRRSMWVLWIWKAPTTRSAKAARTVK